jgi:beta-galactosidase
MITRREFAALPLAALAAAQQRTPLDGPWLFSGPGVPETPVTLPHCVAELGWQDWDPAAWQKVWTYRKRFTVPAEYRGLRVFLKFDGVMVGATPTINGHALAEHLGGYLPFEYEITEHLKPGENELSIAVDGHWRNVPPQGSPRGPISVDYLEPAGIWRDISLYAVPNMFLRDVFARPVDVLDPKRRLEATVTQAHGLRAKVRTELLDGTRVVAAAEQTTAADTVTLTLDTLANLSLWHPDHPRLYDLVTTLSYDGRVQHQRRTRVGFRDARFEVDGFFLNGSRYRLFGLNRHELYPYVGKAMPDRVLRRDAEILRRDFHCNIVRCSHYPQSEAFLDRCDELGLMVWEEIPGWQYLGDATWKELAVRDTRQMVLRDRNHPSIVIWGVRINESANDPELYAHTTAVAKSLDPSRPTSGSMTSNSKKTYTTDWHQDVFAFDDYHAEPDGSVGIFEPVPGVPYLLAEAVGQFNYTNRKNFDAKYRRTADIALQQAQALRHAQAHDRAAVWPRCAGVIAWCAFDYGSLVNSSRALKTPGIADTFRVPKLGAAFYQSQVSPQVQPVIAPSFYWDDARPGKDAAIFSNCDRLDIFLDGKPLATPQPARDRFPNLLYPPFFCDLDVHGTELRIDGHVGDRIALSRSFSTDRTRDRFVLTADDSELIGDGSDATRLVFQVTDRFGGPRAFAGGEVKLAISGPGQIVGDNPFHLADSGGVGAVWIRTQPKSSGRIVVTATHSTLGVETAAIRVR